MFKILGTTDSVHTCERCGRTDLKKAVAVAEVVEGVEGDPMFVGTTCGARLTGREVDSFRRSAKSGDDRRARVRFGSWTVTRIGMSVTVSNRLKGIGEVERPMLRSNMLAALADRSTR